jgi:hypothetical protein
MGSIIIFALTAQHAVNCNVRTKNSIYASLQYEISDVCENAYICIYESCNYLFIHSGNVFCVQVCRLTWAQLIESALTVFVI